MGTFQKDIEPWACVRNQRSCFYISVGILVLVSAIGVGKFTVNRAIAPITRATLVSYLVYGSVVVLIARNTRWAYRTHVEFIIVILFTFGIAALRDWRNRGQTLVHAKLSQVELADEAEQRHTESPVAKHLSDRSAP